MYYVQQLNNTWGDTYLYLSNHKVRCLFQGVFMEGSCSLCIYPFLSSKPVIKKQVIYHNF